MYITPQNCYKIENLRIFKDDISRLFFYPCQKCFKNLASLLFILVQSYLCSHINVLPVRYHIEECRRTYSRNTRLLSWLMKTSLGEMILGIPLSDEKYCNKEMILLNRSKEEQIQFVPILIYYQ